MELEDLKELFKDKEEALDDIKRFQDDLLDLVAYFEKVEGYLFHRDNICDSHTKVKVLLLNAIAELGHIKNYYEIRYNDQLKEKEEL